MPRKGTTGESSVWFVTTIADPAAPTDVEIAAGVHLTPFMNRKGFDRPSTTSFIDASDAASRKDKSLPGNIAAGVVTLTAYRDSVVADDDAYAALPQDAAGYLVERAFGGSNVAIAADDVVTVYVGTIASRSKQPWGDEAQQFVVEFTVEDRHEDVEVVAD